MGELVRSVSALALTVMIATGCSFVLDSNTKQCSVNADCSHFGGEPWCDHGTCVALGPPDCFGGEPRTPEQFANQCTTAHAEHFDNCSKFKYPGYPNCPPDYTTAFRTNVMPQDLGMIPPPITHQDVPQMNCVDAPGNVIYVTGSTNLPPLLKAVQPVLYANHEPGTPPRVVVFAPQTSCKGAAAIYDAAPSKHMIVDTVDNYAFYYDAGGRQVFCKLTPTTGNLVDVGESDVDPSACGYSAQANIADYPGPIQAITFVVPSGSTETVISAEAAHLVFGAGGDSNRTDPWIDPHLYFVRSSGTGTVQLPSRAIGVAPTMWWGIDRLSAANLVESMKAVDPANVKKAIGILSSDFADRNRNNLRVLAFQQQGQQWGYLPDSTLASRDKVNVRDGHYPIWGTIHLMAPTVNSVPSEGARELINSLTNSELEQSVVSALIDAGFVPPCAMKVTRDMKTGELAALPDHSFACGCFFDKEATGNSTCKACTVPSECGTGGACNYGFCEKS